MLLVLLTRLLIWAAVGLLIYWVLLRFIPRPFLTWFGGAIILALIVLSFIEPNDQTIGAIWQVLSLPLTPLGASILLLLFSLGGKGLKNVNGRQVLIALLILLLSSIPLIARSLANQSEQAIARAFANQRALCADICPTIDPVPFSLVSAILVASDSVDGRATAGAFPSQVDADTQLDPALIARLNSTADLYGTLRSQGADPFVVVTSGSVVGTEPERQARDQLVVQLLTSRGVPAEVIRIQPTGMDMYRAAVDLRAFLQERGLYRENVPNREATRVALVAPALTMRRSALTLEQQGLQVVAWPTDLFGLNAPAPGDTLARLSDLVPNVEALRLTTRYWEELLTSIYYFLRGWLPPFNVQWDQIVETVQPPVAP
ncbi:MAG: YdcF family protein [Cyanobacteria bacterium Co-bin13]|nr:YdcF family protein [Cyanobacteria bacterium Co-bin13]